MWGREGTHCLNFEPCFRLESHPPPRPSQECACVYSMYPEVPDSEVTGPLSQHEADGIHQVRLPCKGKDGGGGACQKPQRLTLGHDAVVLLGQVLESHHQLCAPLG